MSKRLFVGADLFLPLSLRRVPDECVDIVRLLAADVAKVVEEAKRVQAQGGKATRRHGGAWCRPGAERLETRHRLLGGKTCWQGQGRG